MPNYRIRIGIYDDENGENLAQIDQPLMSVEEDNAAYVYQVLAAFKKAKIKHEMVFYSKSENDVYD